MSKAIVLRVWQEVCRHLEIAESVDRLAAVLGRLLPISAVHVRRLDLHRACLETVGSAAGVGSVEPAAVKTILNENQLAQVLTWIRQGRASVTQREKRSGSKLSDLARLVVGGDAPGAIAGPLFSKDETPLGALILIGRRGTPFTAAHLAIVQELLEPFTAAMENDSRLREMRAMREALEADNRALLSRLDRQDISDAVVGEQSGLREVMDRVQQVASSDVPVLILGETGSGKEVIARAIHARSKRSDGPILRINCGAIPPELIDSELFGHERGSFTGAASTRKGWFERADGGTLFLDEIGELPMAAQVRMLRILQDGSFEPRRRATTNELRHAHHRGHACGSPWDGGAQNLS